MGVSPDLLSVVVRALAFVALFQATGIAFFMALFGRTLSSAQPAIRRLGLIAAAAGALLMLAHLSLDASRMAGGFSGVWDPDLQKLAWSSKSGISQIAQIAGLLVILAALAFSPRRGATLAGSAGALMAIGAFLLTGHTSVHPLRFVLTPLLALHLLVVAFWFGALIPLVLVTRLEPAAATARIVQRFSAIAVLLVPLIVIAGLAMAALLSGSFGVLRTPYGQLLLVKLAGFIVLLLLAAYNRWRLTPALSLGGTAPDGAAAAGALRRSIAAEYLLIVAVLGVTAVLTAFFSPH